jgi:pyrimidine operon attenuation protein/uracil phosphoribosyltransferase
MTNTPDEQSPEPEGKQVLGPDDVRRAITRMAHEIIERNRGLAGVALVGIQTGGVWVAELLAAEIARIEPETDGVRLGSVDASLYRDDIGLRPVTPGTVSDLTFSVEDATVVLVDDVLYTGRTVRSALDAIGDYGRPKSVQLAVIVDRGHRELPIRPDYVGKNLPTSSEESVSVTVEGVVISGGSS